MLNLSGGYNAANPQTKYIAFGCVLAILGLVFLFGMLFVLGMAIG